MDGGQGAAGRQGAHHAPMSGRSLGWGPALSAGLLAGCSSSFPSGFAFTPQSERAVLAFGLAPEAPSITMHVARIDPDTCRLMGGGGRYERTPFPFTPNKRSFVLDDLEPGFYAVTSVYDGAGLVRFSHTFEDKAQAFELRSGRINYIGDLRLTSFRPEFTGYDEAALRSHLRTLPRITAEPMRVDRVATAFSYAERGPRIAGCTLQPKAFRQQHRAEDQ
jgi:hypothetical protein